MKTAQLINDEVKSAADAMDRAAAVAIAQDQSWELEMTKYTFEDNSVLAVRNTEFFGFDASDAESIKAYSAWLASDDAEESAEVERLLEALEE